MPWSVKRGKPVGQARKKIKTTPPSPSPHSSAAAAAGGGGGAAAPPRVSEREDDDDEEDSDEGNARSPAQPRNNLTGDEKKRRWGAISYLFVDLLGSPPAEDDTATVNAIFDRLGMADRGQRRVIQQCIGRLRDGEDEDDEKR